MAPVTGFDTVHRQPRKGLNDHDTTNKKWGLSWPPVGTYMATSGDLTWPPVGTFSWPWTVGVPPFWSPSVMNWEP